MVQRVKADYMAVYFYQEQTQLLVPADGFGVRRQDLTPTTLGEGLIGQCAKSMRVIAFESAQDLPIQIVWGQGAITPKSVLLLPLVQMNEILGVVVLASAQEFQAETRDEINTLLQTFSIQLGILNRNVSNKIHISGDMAGATSPSPST